MTDEEMAEAWLDIRYLKDMGVRKPCKEAFLAGLKAKTPWHNLRENPNDLPPNNTTVLDENNDKIEYIGYGKWQVYSEYYEKNIEVDAPIAWCEQLIFDKE